MGFKQGFIEGFCSDFGVFLGGARGTEGGGASCFCAGRVKS